MPAKKKTPQPSEEIRSLVCEVYQANQEMNNAKRIYDAKRKELLGAMKAQGIREVKVTAPVGGSGIPASLTVGLVAQVATVTRSAIDVGLLKEVVSDDTFMHCISATKTAVEEHAGKAVAARCTIPTMGEENVSVKLAKP